MYCYFYLPSICYYSHISLVLGIITSFNLRHEILNSKLGMLNSYSLKMHAASFQMEPLSVVPILVSNTPKIAQSLPEAGSRCTHKSLYASSS